MVVFHFKNVAPVDFNGMPGYNIDEPLVIDDGEDKEEDLNIGAQEAKKDKAVEATVNEVGGSVGADIGGSMVVYVGGSVGADVGGSVGADIGGSMVVYVGGSVGANVGGSVDEDVGDSEEEDAGGSVEEDVGDSEEEGSANSNNSFII
ncbi:PREDICTED: circumsporozoite protein-like [Erythranthe guttata]|uniref:circumsporozoite protein-like n=1 Tax=Erythranthe guttata TaxID=4155 RepID=UPI00064DAD60|nr:PREDICTED: circumsporozoite protein-like [Erythranthe guttata]|eukprot:XP_012836387.1 PREDICTED: circumsporozoite protein-like [Erythranthe guttata]